MKTLPSYFRLHPVQTGALVYFLFAGGLTQVPLFNYLGYEFSALLTIPAALISGLLTIGFVRVDAHLPVSRSKFLRVLLNYFAVNAILLLIPLAVISANALIVKNCSFTRGLAYFVLLPVCTMIFAVSMAAAIAVFFRRARLLYVGVIALILCQIGYITYTEPQLFAYNFVLGYFPGITYDETLKDLSTLIAFREFTFVASLFFIIVFFLAVRMIWWDYKLYENVEAFRLRKGDGVLYAGAGVCLVLLLCGHFWGSVFGFQFSARDIQNELGGMATSAHFTLFYPKEALRDREVQVLKGEAEFQYAIDADRMKGSLKPGEKISVYLYASAESKRQFIGTSTTNIAKPWRREIHLTLDSFEETFRHEVVHVLAAESGLPIICASNRMALNEGYATAIDWDWGRFSPHEYAAALQRDKLLGNPEALFELTGFATQQGAYAYVVAGSFARYLIDRYGINSFKEVFPAGHFYEVYGAPLGTLIHDWEDFLRTIDVSSLPRETVETIFAQQSIFRKTCARVTAERNSNGVQSIRVKNYQVAEDEFTASFDDAKTAFALRGLFQSLLGQKKYAEVVRLYETLDRQSQLRFNPGVLFLLGDALWLQGQTGRALPVYRQVEDLNYSDSFSEIASLRCEIVKEPRLSEALGDFFYGGGNDSSRIALLKDLQKFDDSRNGATYLLAEELLSKKKYDEAAIAFQRVSPSFGDRVLVQARLMNGAKAFYSAGEFEKAKSCFWEAQNYAFSTTRLRKIGEWIDRCDFVSANMN